MKCDWSEFYPDAKEMIPTDAPEPLGVPRPRTAAQPLTSKISTYFYALKLRANKIILTKSLPNVLVI